MSNTVELTDNTDQFPKINRKYVLKEVPSGEIRVEQGADGLYLLFDCDCLDALPICQAQCCSLRGIGVEAYEEEKYSDSMIEWDDQMNLAVMIRGADGFCNCLNRENRTCQIYENRPRTCSSFHCTRGARVRGWKLSNAVKTQSFD